MTAYTIFLTLHSFLRWIVLIAGILAILRAVSALLANFRRTGLDNVLGLLFTISLDIQVLVGFILYFALSPLTTENFGAFGEAMGNDEIRFFLVEHIVAMLIAVALAHIGRARAKRADSDPAAFRAAAIFYTLSMLAILVSIPWDRPLFRLGEAVSRAVTGGLL